MAQLFHFPWAPYARKALLAGYELEAKFEEVITPAFEKSVMTALRARTSPLATMPLLLFDDGSFISESSLIVEYFDLAAPERGRLVPIDPHAALEVRGYDRLADALLGPTQYLTWALRKPPAATNHERIAQMRAKMGHVFDALQARLTGRSFLFDERFTMADIGSACAISVLIADRSITLAELDGHPAVRRWYDRLVDRPAWQKMVQCAERVPRPPELA